MTKPTPVAPNDDIIQPFLLEASGVRGRLIRLGHSVDQILTAQDYPPAVAQLLGEMTAMAASLAAALKFDGILTVQTKGDGPISMLVADVTTDETKGSKVRGYASYDKDRLERILKIEQGQVDIRALLGKGYIAFTVDQGQYSERYQGIVELKGSTLAHAIQHYFTQSEQFHMSLQLASGIREGQHRAGAIMIQRLPDEGGSADTQMRFDPSTSDEAWNRSKILLASVTPDELLDASLSANDLLFRLFHEEQVRVYEPYSVEMQCRCSRSKIEGALRSLSDDDIEHAMENGAITVTCEFCDTHYSFTRDDIDAIRNSVLQ